MYALRSPRVLIALAVAAVVVVIGAFVVTRDDKGKDLKTTQAASNCPPVARTDAAATKPNEPIAIDVLANDTDADGDPLVFQIGDTEGGTSQIDDGGTPTDASDDRLLFTPGNPAPASATVEYDALDPSGAKSTSNVAVSINDTATLPDGVRSAFATDPAPAGSQSEACEGSTPTTTDDTLTASGATTTLTIVDESSDTAGSSSNRRTTTTTKGSKSKSTTTTGKKSTTTTDGGSGNDNTPFPTSPPTTKKPTTTTTPGSTTTPPPTSSTTRPHFDCSGYPEPYRTECENRQNP
ncbi:MAG: hypothetical protein QOF21_22 [Actinomycetota bacterium]